MKYLLQGNKRCATAHLNYAVYLYYFKRPQPNTACTRLAGVARPKGIDSMQKDGLAIDRKGTITAALISGVFLVVAAIISGFFLVTSNRIREQSISTATAMAQIMQPVQPAGAQTSASNTPVNMVQLIDFEQGAGDWKLLICADDPCKGAGSQWYEAPSQPAQGQPGFTGEHSLNIQMEFRPDRGQLYSAQYCLTAASLTDVISANIYVPEVEESFKVFVLGYPSGAAPGDPLPFSSLVVSNPGWHRLFLDMRNLPDKNGAFFSDRPLACVHIDFGLPKVSSQQIKTVPFLMDDVEFFK